MPLKYSFVAREVRVLAEATPPNYEGDYQSAGLQLLQRCPTDTVRFVVPVDTLTFNFLVEGGYTFLAVADQELGRELPYAYLEALREEFRACHLQKAQTAQTMGMQRILEPLMRSKMRQVEEHPEEVSKISGLQQQIQEVQQVMEKNIVQLLQHGERLESIEGKGEQLHDASQKFNEDAKQLDKKMRWQNRKWRIILAVVILIVLVIIFLSICLSGGSRCFN